MELKRVNADFLVADQIQASDLVALQAQGIKSIFCHRPDGEGADQPNFIEIEHLAKAQGIQIYYMPVLSGKISDEQVAAFKKLYLASPKPLLAYCRSGMRAISLWALAEIENLSPQALTSLALPLGYDLRGLIPRMLKQQNPSDHIPKHSVIVVGAGAAGIAIAASLLQRQANLDIAIIDPSDTHFYQPGWTMVGGGIFTAESTKRQTAQLLPKGVKWIKAAVAAFDPEQQQVILEGCQPLSYEVLVVCPGLKLNWDGIEGLSESLGKHGVTSNYRYDLAPYTWQLVQSLKQGKALFTQPPMPIKCAGAPQKAMYLSADYWLKHQCLKNIDIEFYTSGAVLFGVEAYVPALMKYIEKYQAQLNFQQQLVKVDGKQKRAWFRNLQNPSSDLIETEFDMIHVVPPQQAPDFVRTSTLVDAAGWLDVKADTLQHRHYSNIFALGDVSNAPNAKTAAAARAQAPIVAVNVLEYLKGTENFSHYNGYGSCPLTVERGKIVLAEFGYAGKLLPSFPKWLIDGQQPSRLAWLLKEQILPPVYWHAMLKGREWMVKPEPALK